ncbi:hypothetical protein [Microbulbifer thermotolerans]|uniref:hypothetical protein n=1 Tax=Microbulbifer thermotolerans TaxID=252514 RepID=UPI00224B70BD|nr:hypothetical protein [Microbulbifer thermotolerans]MCX2778561.1 hypothetical protein [Microbulbifer thermotolerans]MCX2803930.1 hypothetical protein [Microbulbifer thermotolerans]
MKSINYENLNSLFQWMDFIVNKKDVYLEDIDCNLKIFGEGDNSYLVINLYESENRSIEYYFKPDNPDDGLIALISLLNNFKFSLKELLEKLPSQNYVEDDIGCYSSFNGIKVFKEKVISN